MDDIYRGVYRSLSDTTLSDPASEAVNSILDEVTSTRPNTRLREDARHLLLVNFTQMVREPLRLAGRTPPAELSNVLRSDMTTLINDATASPETTDELTARNIIDSISRSWSQLKMNVHGFWD